QNLSGHELDACDALNNFKSSFSKYRKGDKDLTKVGGAIYKVVSALEQMVPFDEFAELVGGEDNLYLWSAVRGFRMGSETLSQPIYSTTIGHSDVYFP